MKIIHPHTSLWHSMIDFADFADFSSDFADFLVLNLVYLCYDIKDQKVNLAGLKLVRSLCVKH